MNYVCLDENTQYRMIDTYIYDSQSSQSRRGFEMCRYSRAAIRLSFTKIKTGTGKLYEHISKLYSHCLVVCKTKGCCSWNLNNSKGKGEDTKTLIRKRLKVLILLGKGEVYFPGKKILKIQTGSRGMRVDLGRGHWLFWYCHVKLHCGNWEVLTGPLEKVSNARHSRQQVLLWHLQYEEHHFVKHCNRPFSH